MNKPTQRQTFVGCLGLAMLAFLAAGCSSGDGGIFSSSSHSSTEDMSGNWTFASMEETAPSTTTCSGDLADFAMTLRPSFAISLAQVGSSVSGEVSVPCPGGQLGPASRRGPGSELSFDGGSLSGCMDTNLAFAGAVSGSAVAGDLTTTIDGRVYSIAFAGFLDGDIAVITTLNLTGDGLSGGCATSGSYLATR